MFSGTKSRSLVVVMAAGATLLAACGSSSSSSTQPAVSGAAATQPATASAPTTAAAPATEAPTTAAPASSASASAAPAIKTATSSLGTILVTDKGLTVYTFMPDTAGKPTCTGGCAQTWPPVTVASDDPPAGLDPKVFSVVEGAGGTFQLKAGQWPLYTFSGDQAPGDTNGQDTGDKWYVVSPTGEPIKE